MLLDEEPAALIAACRQSFKIDSDRSAISRIGSALSDLNTFRSSIISQHSSQLQKLVRQQQTLNSQHSLTVSSHNPTSHASNILRLDTEKFRVAKQASDLEIEEERMGAELDSLKSTLQEVEEQGPEGGEALERELAHPEENETVLKLRIYRDLGMGVEVDPATGDHNRVIFQKSGDVHYLGRDKKMDLMFYCNMFWDKL
ncbi:Spc24-domain-containing protein [Pseudovirgaria hyperparasitica]|uniref:Kinetochore protein Spc24 n=1 Tax=Pseudovirgaria hyperparasitica TaxID=470096 RepID=A0A6A6WHR9_9PEZI|nr:Spc24-domain-containing protein [Pseudovirgaria hyperparasitica]KAF2762352.1 Spc24-domain-containing protein [Pseudovirgaria hyperparasitica]